MTESSFDTARVSEKYDYVAPDGSRIRHLLSVEEGNLVHCTLPPRTVSKAHRHRTVKELWYVLSGEGEVWRKHGDHQKIVDVSANVSLSIPAGTHFQFRTNGRKPLCILIVTMPPWPGSDEAVRVPGPWNPDVAERGNTREKPVRE